MRVVVVHPVKINKVPYARDMVIDIEDEKIATQLMSGGAVRQLQMPAEIEIVKVPVASDVVPTADEISKMADQSFEQWVNGGNEPRDYPPRGFTAQDTPAWRAYQVSLSASMAKESVPQRAMGNPGFMPTIRPLK
jgi:hypothetical protein